MNVFYFVSRWPRSKDSARADKILSLTETLLNLGHEVCLLSPDTTPADNSPDVSQMPIDTVFLNPKKIGTSLASAHKKPDLAIFNCYRMEQMYSIFMYSKWNKCPRILQINRLNGLQQWRKKNYLTLGSPFIHQYDALSYPGPQQDLTTKFLPQQLEAIQRSDYYFCGNDFISHYMKKHLNISRNTILHSMGIPQGDFIAEINDLEFRAFSHRKHYGFVGNLTYEKNVRMINLIIDKIWPNIRKELPKVQLHIYGAGFNKQLQSKKKQLQRQGIFLMGVMDDLQDIQKYRALLYPIQYTTGTKGAIVESWFRHTPVVTTPIGAEGLFDETRMPLFSANAKGQPHGGFFKEKIITNEEENGQKLVENYYNTGKLSQKINTLSFGGLCNSFSYTQFTENALKLYTDQSLWNACLLKGRTSFLKHHAQSQMQVNLGYGISQVEMEVYEARRKKEYNQAWDNYVRSKEGYNKLHQKQG